MVQIITDSSTLYTAEEALSCGFEAVPLCVTIGDLEGRDLQMDMDDYYGRIQAGQVPLSSQPPIGDVVECFEKYEDTEIINISMADGLSGTYQGACAAREMISFEKFIFEYLFTSFLFSGNFCTYPQFHPTLRRKIRSFPPPSFRQQVLPHRSCVLPLWPYHRLRRKQPSPAGSSQ